MERVGINSYGRVISYMVYTCHMYKRDKIGVEQVISASLANWWARYNVTGYLWNTNNAKVFTLPVCFAKVVWLPLFRILGHL